jgi:hypothetical protein
MYYNDVKKNDLIIPDPWPHRFFIKRKNSDKFTNFKTPHFLFISARVQQRHSPTMHCFPKFYNERENAARQKSGLNSHGGGRRLPLNFLQREGLTYGQGRHRGAGAPLGSRQDVGRKEARQGRPSVMRGPGRRRRGGGGGAAEKGGG